MKNSQRQLTTAGTGLAAAAAGYGASRMMGGDSTTSLAVGTGVGLTASMLAHIIGNKVSQRGPIFSPAGSLGAAGATGLGVAHAGLALDHALQSGGSYAKAGDSVKKFLGDLKSKNKTLESFIAPVEDIYAGMGKMLADANQVKNIGGKQVQPGKLAKLLNLAAKNKGRAAATVAGLLTIPTAYSFFRGNGSD